MDKKLISKGVYNMNENKTNTVQEKNQEQYIGKCNHCGHDNEFKLPIGEHLPNGVFPKFCMKCGKPTQYHLKG